MAVQLSNPLNSQKPEVSAVEDTLSENTGRVLVVVRHPVGGIRTYLRYTYPVLAARYRFTFVLPEGPDLAVFSHTMNQCLQANGGVEAEYVTVPTRKGKCPLRIEVGRQIRSGRFGMMHSQGFTAAMHGVLGNLPQRIPHVTTIHDVVRQEHRRGVRGLALRLGLGWCLRQTDVVIAVGEDVRENLLTHLRPLLPSGRVKVIRNGIDVEHYSRNHGTRNLELHKQLGLPSATMLLGFLGRFMEQKGFLSLLEALKLLRQEGDHPPFHLVAVGSDDRQRAYLRKAAELGLSEVISNIPFVSDVQPILRQLDLLVMPSLWEAMPLLPMEAMVAGVPVLGSDCIGLREALAGSPSRMFPAGDAAALAQRLREALHCPWTEEAREYANQAGRRFDVRPRMQELLGVFERVLPRGTAGHRREVQQAA